MFFICFRLFTNGMKFGFVCLVFDCFLMESQAFRWLCVNVVDMWVLLGGTSVFWIVFERPVGALHAELAVEGEQRCVRSRCLQRTYLFIISPLAACLLL